MMGFEPKPPLYRPFQALEETIEIFRTTKKNMRIYIHRLLTFIVTAEGFEPPTLRAEI